MSFNIPLTKTWVPISSLVICTQVTDYCQQSFDILKKNVLKNKMRQKLCIEHFCVIKKWFLKLKVSIIENLNRCNESATNALKY
jgi:hypothetical protein